MENIPNAYRKQLREFSVDESDLSGELINSSRFNPVLYTISNAARTAGQA